MLEVSGLTHEYGSLRVLDGISFAAQEGEFIALVGPNGCGKTTLLRLIAGLEKPSGGTITIDGRPVEGPGPDRGFVFQEYALFPWLRVVENVEFGLKMRGVAVAERRQIAHRFLNRMGLMGFEDYRPDQLSGGMKQRVAIARALANDPQLLLMDEPFAALDCQTRNEMQDELQEVWQQDHKTVLFVTHNLEEAAVLADRVIVLSPRPTRIAEILKVDLSRPRNRTGLEVNQLRVYLHRALRSRN